MGISTQMHPTLIQTQTSHEALVRNEYLLNQRNMVWRQTPVWFDLSYIPPQPQRPAASLPLKPCVICSPEGDFTCNSHLVSRIQYQIPEGREGGGVRQKSSHVRIWVSHLQAWLGPLQLPGSAEDRSASVLKSWQASVHGLRYIQAQPFKLKWDTKLFDVITGRDLSGALPLVWSLTLWLIISPFMTWERKERVQTGIF